MVIKAVVINFDYAPGATPLDPDEAAGLIPTHIVNHAQLNEWELANIVEAERWAFTRKHKNLLQTDFIKKLHKRMLADTWRWAGTFRVTEKNIGIDPIHIQPALYDLCEDVKTQLAHNSYPLDEIAARFSHRLVAIHPFANGNGRLSRMMADLLLEQHDAARFSWAAKSNAADAREQYLSALRAADRGDYEPFLQFIRS